jgi:hypothetical protein
MQRAPDLAAQHCATPVLLRCTCPEQTAKLRIAQRRQAGASLSEARPELFNMQRDEQETPPPGLIHVDIDTPQPLEKQLTTARECVSQVLCAQESLKTA